MSAAATNTQVETKVTNVLSERYPQKSGYKRKIVPLWDNYYRVNYLKLDGTGVESVFVSLIPEGKVHEFPEEKENQDEEAVQLRLAYESEVSGCRGFSSQDIQERD